ncbi:MAG TPA: 6-carboxytetrahydropterin synthase QueD [bacterium]|nr:6-carboxytetrahydropterin synthase QueD [bacterium]
MYKIKVIGGFSSAHRLKNYKGKCEHLHGHNWKVEIIVSGTTLDNTGLLIDFGILKKKLDFILKQLDHKNLNTIPFFNKTNPTSENISYYIFTKLKELLKNLPIKLEKVIVWENEKQCASYME